MTTKNDPLKTGLIELFSLCAEVEDERLRAELIDLFLSDKEKTALSNRYWVIKALIKADKSQRTIAEKLQVSIAKITRGSNELKRINPALLSYLKDHL